MTRSSETDQEYRISGGLMLAGGAAVTYWSWSAARSGTYAMTSAVLGPTLVALGIGLLIHGTGISIAGINTRTRLYGLAGAGGTVALLAAYGFFARPAEEHAALWWAKSALPFALGVYWLLPANRLGGKPHDPLAGAIAAAEAEKAARARPVHGSERSQPSEDAVSRSSQARPARTNRERS